MEIAAPKNLFFYELCRLCLVNAGARDVFETSDLLGDIYDCTGVKVSPSDNLPHKICMKCSEVVASSKELRQLASKNDAYLHTLFGGIEDNNDSEGDTIQKSTHPTHKTMSKHKSRCPKRKSTDSENSSKLNNQNSSKAKLSLLPKADEENDSEATPKIRQTISLRKDLFPPTPTSSPDKSKIEKHPYHTLLHVKVEAESPSTKMEGDDDDDDTEYICGTCRKAFDNRKKLYLHQRLHNKKLSCPLDACSKKFAMKGDLDKHLRTHTGEKPFLCKICEKGFTQRVSLRAHLACMHGENVKQPKDEEVT